MRRMAIALGAVIATAVLGLGQTRPSNSEPLTGTWQCMSHGGSNGDMEFTLDLQQDGETVTGSVDSPLGGTDISSATFKDNTLEIHIDTDQVNYVLTAKLIDGKLTGQWSTDSGEKGTWEGKKAAKTEPSE
jgi:hypothetical protein